MCRCRDRANLDGGDGGDAAVDTEGLPGRDGGLGISNVGDLAILGVSGSMIVVGSDAGAVVGSGATLVDTSVLVGPTGGVIVGSLAGAERCSTTHRHTCFVAGPWWAVRSLHDHCDRTHLHRTRGSRRVRPDGGRHC
jgi:hypothetical protein